MASTHHKLKASKCLRVVTELVELDTLWRQILENHSQGFQVHDWPALLGHACNLTSALCRAEEGAQRRNAGVGHQRAVRHQRSLHRLRLPLPYLIDMPAPVTERGEL